jgi:hypothetical protein
VDGITVTTIDLDDEEMEVFGNAIEPRITMALGDGVLLIGTGDFALEALGRAEAESLAVSERFTSGLEAVGTPNSGFAWIDLPTLVTFVASTMGSDERVRFEQSVQPILAPLDYLAIALNGTDGSVSARAVLAVR